MALANYRLRVGATASLPAWLSGAAVNEWIEISGTTWDGCAADIYNDGPSSASLVFGNVAVAGTELISAAGGGHGDSWDNSVKGIDIGQDSPSWVLRKARTAFADITVNAAYNVSDGTPTSRHLYWGSQYSTTRSRLMLHFTRVYYSNADSSAASNGFDLANNAWDAAGSWSDGKPALCRDSDDNCWSVFEEELWKWNPTTDAWSAIAAVSGSPAVGNYGPMAHDSNRGQLFLLKSGNGSAGSGLTAYKFTTSGTQTAITFNASAAYTQWLADAPSYASMAYSAIEDRFYFWHGMTNANVYVVTPNSGSVWDMEILATTGTESPLAYTEASVSVARHGAFGRMVLVEISGHQALIFVPSLSANIRAIRIN